MAIIRPKHVPEEERCEICDVFHYDGQGPSGICCEGPHRDTQNILSWCGKWKKKRKDTKNDGNSPDRNERGQGQE